MQGNLLIIDDEIELLERTAMLLEDIADKVLTASSGKEGLDIIEKNEIHCVICDINMPHLNGVEVLKRLRSTNPNLPFIFYTGHGSRELMIEAVKLGAFDFIDKPSLDGLEEVAVHGLKLGVSQISGEATADSTPENFISEYRKLLNDSN